MRSALVFVVLLLGCPDETGETPDDDDDAVGDDDDFTLDDDDVADDADTVVDDDDTVADDDDTTATANPGAFTAMTGGGDVISSPNYTLELFVAPQAPPSEPLESPSYRLRLGPAAQRVGP